MTAPLYCTVADVRLVLSRNPWDTTGTAGELADVVIEAAIDMACGHIDARLAQRYFTPFPQPYPRIVVQMAIALAAFHADLDHRQSEDIRPDDPVNRRRSWAMDLLANMVSKNADIPHGELVAGVPTGMSVSNAYRGHLFELDDFDLVDADAAAVNFLDYRW